MIQLHPFSLEQDRKRFMRPDAYRFLRSDWRRFTGGRQDPLHQLFERAEHKYRPDQPRVPQGSSGGGQWTRDNSSVGQSDPRIVSDAPDLPTLGSQYAQNRTRETVSRVLINGQIVEATPGQQARLAVVEAQARDAIRRVQELDPKWRPTPSAYESVEGLIEAHRADARQATGRISELQSVGIGPGPFAGESIPARGPDRDFVVMERANINRIGSETGCHTCGTMYPRTPLDNFVLDHQPPTAWNPLARPQRLYPQCLSSSSRARKLDKSKWGKAVVMQTSRIIRPVNSIIFICDRAGGTVPHWQKDRQILSTDSCISVACYPEQDGPTKVTLGFANEVDPGHQPDFNGALKTPNRVLTVQNAPHETLLAMNVTKEIIRVQVWLNSKKWADDIIIGVSES